MTSPIITIDGPSGSGKGTICQLLASALNFHLLDSGAMYRVTAVAAAQNGIDFTDQPALATLAENLDVSFTASDNGVVVILDGIDITREIRQETASMGASTVAAYPAVRQALLARQRAFAKARGLVADGRDMGTTVFPQAELKIFLTASAEERAQRRYKQLRDRGESVSLRALLEDIKARDERDMQRSASPLKPANDAFLIDSSTMTIDEVLDKITLLAKGRVV